MKAAVTFAALLLMGAATTALAVLWQDTVRVSADEPQDRDFQVPLNNAWGVQSYDFQPFWFGSPESIYASLQQERVHVVFWYETDEGYNDVRFARSNDGGGTFPVEDRKWISVEDDEDEAWTPTIAAWGPRADTHDVLVAYYDEHEIRADQRYSIFRRRNDRQGDPNAWLGRVAVSGDEDDASERPSMAVCRRRSATTTQYYQHVVWEDDVDANTACIWYFRDLHTQGDDADSFSFDERLTEDDGYGDRNPSVAAALNPANDSNYVYVVWFDTSVNSRGEVWFLRSTNTGRNWLPKVNLSNTFLYESQSPCVAAFGSHVYVVWQEQHPETRRYRIMFRRSANYGASWLAPECISEDLMAEAALDHNLPPECFAPSIACYRNFVYVVCQAGWDSPEEWYTVGFMMSDNNGGAWKSEGIQSGGTDEQPDLELGLEGLFPTVSVSQGTGQTERKYLNVLYRAWDANEDYQVYYLRGNRIDQMPGSAGGGQAGPGVPVRRLNLRPSIVKTMTRIDLELVRQGVVDLSVYDVQGRQVRCLGKGLLPHGWYHTSWDGRDQAGRRLSSGAYLVVLKSESGILTRRVQLVGE